MNWASYVFVDFGFVKRNFRHLFICAGKRASGNVGQTRDALSVLYRLERYRKSTT